MNILLYLFWELSFFACAAVGAQKILQKTQKEKDETAQLLILTVGLKLFAQAFIAQTAAFFGLISQTFLLIIASLVAILAFLFKNKPPSLKEKHTDGFFISCALAFILITPALAGLFAPLIDFDSVYHSHWIVGMSEGRATPFDFSFHYVFLWETSFLPVFVLTDAGYYYPYHAVQALLFLLVACYLLHRQIGMTALLALLLALSILFFGHFWHRWISGIGSLKNDVIYAAATATMMLACLRWGRDKNKKMDPRTITLFALAMSFIAVKYSGLFVAGGIVIIAFLIWKPKIEIKKLAVIAVCFMASSGIYYLWNIIQFGNMFYPVPLDFGLVTLQGASISENNQNLYQLDNFYFLPALAGSKIINHINELKTWLDMFFNHDKSGVLFSPLFLSLFLLLPCILWRKGMAYRDGFIFLWCCAIFLWILFIHTPLSYGMRIPHLKLEHNFILFHVGFRYVLLGLHLVYVLPIAFLICSPKQFWRMTAWMILAIELIGRPYLLYEAHFFHKNIALASAWMAFATLIMVIAYVRRYSLIVACAAFFAFSLSLVPWSYRLNKSLRGETLMVMDELPSQKEVYNLIWPLSEDKIDTMVVIHPLAAQGSDFRHEYRGYISPYELARLHQEGAPLPAVLLVTSVLEAPFMPSDIKAFETRLAPFGYKKELAYDASVVFIRQKHRLNEK